MSDDRSPVGRIFGAIVPRAVDSIDPDALVDRIDVDALVERIDVDGLIQRVDVDALLTRIDVDGLLDRIDIGRLLDRIDVDGLISRVDLDALLATVDVDALIARIDVDGLVARLDADALIARLDVDALVARLDVNALVGRLDVEALLANVDVQALVARAGIDKIVAEATTGVAARTLDLARRQLLGVDLVLLGFVDRVFRRGSVRDTVSPAQITGRPAGPVSRLIGFLLDSFLVSVLFSVVVFLTTSLIGLFLGDTVQATDSRGGYWATGFLFWWFLYLWISLVVAGRTPGKALVGLRVAGADGLPLRAGRAALRVVVFPFSFVLGLGFIPAVVRRDRRALHDLVAGSAEVVDWGDRSAQLPSALASWLDQHGTAVA